MAKVIPFVIGQHGALAEQQQRSVADKINGGLEFATGNSLDASGYPNSFSKSNISSHIVRVTATGGTPPADGVNWTASNTKIPHSLGRVPIGFFLAYSNKVVTIHAGTSVPDKQFIYLTCSDTTANTNILVF